MDSLTLKIIVCLIVLVFSGLLNALGGKHWLYCRRYLMPTLFIIGCGFVTGIWWSGLLSLPVMGTLTLGYPGIGNNPQRALWLFMQSVSFSLGLFLTSIFGHYHFLTWYFFLGYILITGVLGGLYKNWFQWKGDWVTGSYLCGALITLILLTVYFKL